MTEEEPVAVDHRPPGEVFGLLSNELRVEVVRALGEADRQLSFSGLQDVVGERDSGKFNDHLGELVGHFVTKDEDGYRPSIAGEQVYGAIMAGTYTANVTIHPFEFEGPCPRCGTDSLVAAYADETAKLYCEECGEWRNEFPFPPGTLEQFARHELSGALDRWMRATVTKFLQGLCGNCSGRIDGTLERSDGDESASIRALFECGRCGDELRASPSLPALYHPVTITFFERHGVDVLHDPSWGYYDQDDDLSVELVNDDPLTAQVSVTVGGETLVAQIGPDATIENKHRRQ